MNQHTREITDSITLNNLWVSKRIIELADVENQLVSQLKVTKFALQIDESFLPNSTTKMMCYIRYLHEHKLKEELLLSRMFKTAR